MSVFFIFPPVGRLFAAKYCVLHMSQNVLYSSPYLDAVMQKHCIRQSKVSSQMYGTHLMDDACFNHIVEKNNISSSLCSLMPYGLP